MFCGIQERDMGMRYSKKSQTLPSKKSIKIVNLNDDCLDHVFNYLDFVDLLNVGQSNTRFQYAARIVFKRKYDIFEMSVSSRGNELWLMCGIENSKRKEQIDMGNNILQFQRLIWVFGDLISSIKLYYNIFISDSSNIKSFEQIFYEISEHPLESVIRIEFDQFPTVWVNKFLESKDLSLISNSCKWDLGNMLLSQLFPKLKHLKISFMYHNIPYELDFDNGNDAHFSSYTIAVPIQSHEKQM